MSSGLAFATVESSLIDQIISLTWKLVIGNFEQASVTGRETFREVLIKSVLRKAIERTLLSDCEPRLEEGRRSQVVSAPEVTEAQKPRVTHRGLVEKLVGRPVKVPPLLTEGTA